MNVGSCNAPFHQLPPGFIIILYPTHPSPPPPAPPPPPRTCPLHLPSSSTLLTSPTLVISPSSLSPSNTHFHNTPSLHSRQHHYLTLSNVLAGVKHRYDIYMGSGQAPVNQQQTMQTSEKSTVPSLPHRLTSR